MKLIDLDKAVSICDADDNAVIWTNIKNAEVKAIPIEWIREYICDLEVVISSMRKSYFPNEQAIYNQQFRVFQIKSLLEDWEKENETN